MIDQRHAVVDGKSVKWSMAIVHSRKTNAPLKCHCCKREVDHFDLYNGAMHAFVRNESSFSILSRDHIIPKSLGGSYNINNIRLMCQQCNSKRGTAFTLTEAIDAIKLWGEGVPGSSHVVHVAKNAPRLKLTNPVKMIYQLKAHGVVIL